MKFTLTFEGALQTGGAKAERKHLRRKIFHDQLRRLWTVNSLLANWNLPINDYQMTRARDVLAQKYARFGEFEFVPLVTRDLSVEAALHFHILRPTTIKGHIADSDNIVKILIDSLKMPQNPGELPNEACPEEDEKPFFVLMQDDGLLSKVIFTTDELLQPILGKKTIDRNDTRVMIDVNIRPNFQNTSNTIFFSDDFEVWNHQWASALDGIRSWSNAELKARTTQCVLRMRVTASNFRMQRSVILGVQASQSVSEKDFRNAFRAEMEQSRAQAEEQRTIWNLGLRPIAAAILGEIRRRIYGEAPYPDTEVPIFAIEVGSLAGIDAIDEAAIGLESLMRQLP